MNITYRWLVIYVLFLSFPLVVFSQNTTTLKIEEIMQGQSWVGHSPSNLRWSDDSKTLYFDWNPENLPGDSLYYTDLGELTPQKVPPTSRRSLPSFSGKINKKGDLKIYEKDGDLFLLEIPTGNIKQLTHSIQRESNPDFLNDNSRIVFQIGGNLHTWDLKNGQIRQLTNFRKGYAGKKDKPMLSKSDQWLKQDQLNHFEVLKLRKEKREAREKIREQHKPRRPKAIYHGNKSVSALQLSPDEKFVTFRLTETLKGAKSTVVPNYVTEGGYTEDIKARSKVGGNHTTYKMGILDLERDSCYYLNVEDIPGIYDIPAYLRTNKKKVSTSAKMREAVALGPLWSENGRQAVIVVRALDNKDRWIMSLDVRTGEPRLLDRQQDDAWIGGPGIGSWNFSMGKVGWMPDNESIWYVSEESGYAHLCVVNTKSGKKKTVTKGKFEIYNPQISRDKKYFYFGSNEAHPGERHYYKVSVNGGKPIKLTQLAGRNDVFLSPDEKTMAILHSYTNQPWELYLAENKADNQPKRITHSQAESFKTYSWRDPEIVTFKASDGAKVNARLYRPSQPQPDGPAVIFVHGAGYLQNAHKWWSSYYREFMFHNYLADHGYTVLDIDYRGSAGYGRDWRTGIYRYMGGKDLEDQVDGARFLTEKYNVSPQRIGIYGGSYGGFITLMAMFTKPGTFKAGAALRSVTDWAHYNHPYTANILNTPELDSMAYIKSSPIYYAEGLQDALLICHGMVDTNVHFQDVVRLAQRLIELGKENWEFAVYPVENHGFVEPSSWIDEYKRIFQLFERNLK
ncbi:prolyl oligopeptidase family serine peptidase [Fulvivirgaceae bacterium BMA12]|uniref:Prolyl oligopeptidase family serine peptidase n=1 Tax=Agaribacillus aureus TaxID=3051825 RepID=A0ABT8LK84_9BACT|nr:prolyl oligopeptidase family serine peptidase [Fulvivirgaceae bacterium BMA12]